MVDLCSGRDAHHDEGDTVRGEGRRKEGGREVGRKGREGGGSGGGREGKGGEERERQKVGRTII